MTEKKNLIQNQKVKKAEKRTDFFVTYSFPFGMPMPNRTYSLSSSKYRFGFNGQEKDDEVYGAGNLNTAEFWEYDTRIGRRWNVDPVVKEWESPYLTFGGNALLFSDPKGDDKIFYNQDGTEIADKRVVQKGIHEYYLSHKDGNIEINGERYFQGNSYYSFFGDAGKFDKPTLFSKIDYTSLPTLSKEVLEENTDKSDSKISFWLNSGSGSKHDYKNRKKFNSNEKTGMDAANITTAYMVDGVLYNRNETGMLLWGAAAQRAGFKDFMGLAMWNARIHELIEGNGDEHNEVKCWTKGWSIMNGKDISNALTNRYFSFNYPQGTDPTKKGGLRYDYSETNKADYSIEKIRDVILTITFF